MHRHDTGKHESPTPPATRRLAATMAMIAFLVVAGFFALTLAPNDEPRAAAGSRSSATTPSPSGPVPSPTTPTVDPAAVRAVAESLEQCRLSNLRQKSALSSAALSMSMWDKHIEAMNLLVAGKITLAVAHDFWNSSRVGAVEAVADFHAADESYTALSGSSCAPLSESAAAAAEPGEAQSLSRCATEMPDGDAVLAQARPAVSTWEHHIHDMEALRNGDITPKQATVKWLRDWKAGQAQLDRYNRVVAADKGEGCQLR